MSLNRAIIVAVVTGLLVFGWRALQPLMPSLMPVGAGVSLLADADRIGRPAVAPVVRSCSATVFDLGSETKTEASAVYHLLKAGGLQADVRAMRGKSDARSEAMAILAMTSGWGQMATCIFAQERRALCDSDSRAAAVEAITKFMIYAERADVSRQKPEMAITADDMRTIEAIRARLLDALKTNRRDGIFVASDFGAFPPTKISEVMREEKELRNVCRS